MMQLMGEVLHDGVDGGARALARVAEPFHAMTYYSRELFDWTDAGYRGWWHAYFAYRSAPMGAVGAATVGAVFYNFAPRMVERAVPGVWAIQSPSDTIVMRRQRVARALDRVFGGGPFEDRIATAAPLMRRAVEDCDGAGRALFASYGELQWPEHDALALWHGCTLLREHRGDSHAIALANVAVDGVMSHVLMAGRGHGNKPTILAIRGWTEDEWEHAVGRLTERGWARPDGSLTERGERARSEIERHTDELASEPVTRLGADDLNHLVDAMKPLVEHLRASGEVSGRWPPAHLIKRDGE